MRLLKLAGLWASVAWAAGRGGGAVGSNSREGAASNNNSTSASLAISATKMGAFSVAMSSSFQPAEWDDQFFLLNPSATTALGKLGPHPVRLQGVSGRIAVAPAFMYDSNHNLDFEQFAAYTQNLVRCYHVPASFTGPDGQHASPSGIPTLWWGIYNEPNFNVTLDVSALGDFTSANLLVIDKDTSVANGPAAVPMIPEAKMALD